MPDHPLLRIPPLLFPAPPVATAKGLLPAERSLAYDRTELLLHGPAATHDAQPFSLAELAGYHKTAHRLLLILDRLPFHSPITPLHWRSPEELLFLLPHLELAFDLIHLHQWLEQAERLHYHRSPAPFLHFQRA